MHRNLGVRKSPPCILFQFISRFFRRPEHSLGALPDHFLIEINNFSSTFCVVRHLHVALIKYIPTFCLYLMYKLRSRRSKIVKKHKSSEARPRGAARRFQSGTRGSRGPRAYKEEPCKLALSCFFCSVAEKSRLARQIYSCKVEIIT